MGLREIVRKSDTRAGRWFDLGIEALIVISVVSFSIETLPNLSPTTEWVLVMIEIVTVILFTAEYLLRLAVAEHKLRFVFSFFGIIDLIAVLPFYLAPHVDLRAVRILRLLRLFRILKLARYTRALERFAVAFRTIREELIIYLATTALMIYVASVAIYYFESEAQPENFASVFHAMWWSIVTLTTVGYGDVYPVTLGGRLFTGLLLMLGVGVISVPSGLIAAALTRTRPQENPAGEAEGSQA